MNHLSKIITSRADRQKVIRAFQERRNISYRCVRSRISQRDLQITVGRKNTRTKKEKEMQRNHRHKQTHRHGGGSVFMTPHSHLDDVYTHIHSMQKCAHTPRTTHCWGDLFKSQELCLSFATSCSQKYLWTCSVVFSMFWACICTYRYIHTYVWRTIYRYSTCCLFQHVAEVKWNQTK